MEEIIEHTPVALLGAGNLATNLGKALSRKGFRILQVFSRTEQSAQELAKAIGTDYITDLEQLSPHARLCIAALKDDAIAELAPQIARHARNALLVHTAGSLSIDIWKGHAERYGVFYPMQTFSKQQEVDFGEIPFFIEANSPDNAALLKKIAGTLSASVHELSSEERKRLHLAAVFASNFTNHMYAMAHEVLKDIHLPFDILLPLIDETARKVHRLSPQEAQTGPAIRYDEKVIRSHINLLEHRPRLQEIYKLLSKSIHEYH